MRGSHLGEPYGVCQALPARHGYFTWDCISCIGSSCGYNVTWTTCTGRALQIHGYNAARRGKYPHLSQMGEDSCICILLCLFCVPYSCSELTLSHAQGLESCARNVGINSQCQLFAQVGVPDFWKRFPWRSTDLPPSHRLATLGIAHKHQWILKYE